MADYKRIVSYIYQYNHQLKGNNVGFTRLEIRNGQCKIIVHVRVPNLQNMTVKVCTYCWYDGVIHGIILGDMNISGGVGEFKILTQAEDLCHTQYHLADMGGILVYISDNVFLGTEWDNRPIRFDVLLFDEERPADFYQRRNLNGGDLTEAVKETAIAAEMTLAISEEQSESVQQKESIQIENVVLEDQPGKEDSLQEFVEVNDSEEVHAADLSPENDVEQDEDLDSISNPLNIKRMERLDHKAHELFGNMLSNSVSASRKVLSEKEEETPVIVNPKTAIEYFTTFKSCESKEEYLELQQEIKNLHGRIEQLERVSMEWKIKEARIREQKLARLEAEKEKQQIEEELRRSFHIEKASDIYGDSESENELKVADYEEKTDNKTLEYEQEPLEKQETASEEEDEDDSMDDGGMIHPVVQRILTRYPAIEPFLDVEEGNCVRIEPQDIGIFPMENWILANNSFLLHGYYSYRHLIFFCKHVYNRHVYLLGIPGVNHSRERFMANMFGFSMFQPLTRVQGENVQAANRSMTGNPAYDEVQGGEFGYWCMEIVF